MGAWGKGPALVENDIPPDVPAAVCRGIVIAKSLYAFGALLCVVSTFLEHHVHRAGAVLLRSRTAPARQSSELM